MLLHVAHDALEVGRHVAKRGAGLPGGAHQVLQLPVHRGGIDPAEHGVEALRGRIDGARGAGQVAGELGESIRLVIVGTVFSIITVFDTLNIPKSSPSEGRTVAFHLSPLIRFPFGPLFELS